MTWGMQELVLKERKRQFEKWGSQAHSLSLFHVILSEEVGELAEEILNKDLAYNPGREEQLLTEAVHVAAVALALVQRIQTGHS